MQQQLLAASQPNPDDIAYTPDAVADLFVQALRPYMQPGQVVWEPHAGGGAFVRAVRREGYVCHGSDLYAAGWARHDLLAGDLPFGPVDWLIGNPPFSTAREHVEMSLRLALSGVAYVLPAQLPYLVGWADLWERATPDMLPACGRVPFLGDGTVKERDGKQAGTRDVAMYVWRRHGTIWSTEPCVLRPLRTPRSRT